VLLTTKPEQPRENMQEKHNNQIQSEEEEEEEKFICRKQR